jgi:hypothetical protein
MLPAVQREGKAAGSSIVTRDSGLTIREKATPMSCVAFPGGPIATSFQSPETGQPLPRTELSTIHRFLEFFGARI